MSKRCIISNCGLKRSEGVTLFKFPDQSKKKQEENGLILLNYTVLMKQKLKWIVLSVRIILVQIS